MEVFLGIGLEVIGKNEWGIGERGDVVWLSRGELVKKLNPPQKGIKVVN